MSQKIDFPNDRLVYSNIGSPVFDSDIQNGTQNLNLAIKMLLGVQSSFSILQGVNYDSGTQTYSSGYIYLNGIVYYCATGLALNQYLAPNPTDTCLVQFKNGNSYNTYRIYYAIASDSPQTGCPQFTGDMNNYRRSIDWNFQYIINALNLHVGTSPVASLGEGAGNDDSEFGIAASISIFGNDKLGTIILTCGANAGMNREYLLGITFQVPFNCQYFLGITARNEFTATYLIDITLNNNWFKIQPAINHSYSTIPASTVLMWDYSVFV